MRTVRIGPKTIPPFLKASPIPKIPAPTLPRNRCISVSTYLQIDNYKSHLRKGLKARLNKIIDCADLLTMLDDQFEYGRLRLFHDQFGHIDFLSVYYCVYHFHSPQFEALMTFLELNTERTKFID